MPIIAILNSSPPLNQMAQGQAFDLNLPATNNQVNFCGVNATPNQFASALDAATKIKETATQYDTLQNYAAWGVGGVIMAGLAAFFGLNHYFENYENNQGDGSNQPIQESNPQRIQRESQAKHTAAMAATTKAKAAALAESQKPTPIDPFAWPTVLGVLPNAVQFFYKLLGGDMNQVKEVLQIRELKHIVSPKKLHEIEKQAAKQAEEFFEKNHAYPKTFGALWRKERQIKLSILQYLKEHFDEQDGKK